MDRFISQPKFAGNFKYGQQKSELRPSMLAFGSASSGFFFQEPQASNPAVHTTIMSAEQCPDDWDKISPLSSTGSRLYGFNCHDRDCRVAIAKIATVHSYGEEGADCRLNASVTQHILDWSNKSFNKSTPRYPSARRRA